jgi:hypothetical protein
MNKQRFYGKYRGLVTNPIDPKLKGRVFASVTVGGAPLEVWAEACTPYAGPGVGFFAIPPVGAGVWIEFEDGDLDKPIWTGCWWREGDIALMLTPDVTPPSPAAAAAMVVLRTPTTRLNLNTLTGMATLESLLPPATPATPVGIKITPALVEVSCGALGTVKISPAGIFLNETALTVLPG